MINSRMEFFPLGSACIVGQEFMEPQSGGAEGNPGRVWHREPPLPLQKCGAARAWLLHAKHISGT